ncbi:MAG: multicopper oxidase domain-containing protein [Chloroflexi bacterium]|nr:multicopper oxidase domain-containing protein [Chloroflexota bacterium]
MHKILKQELLPARREVERSIANQGLFPKLRTSRRQFLRTSGVGLSLSALIPWLSACGLDRNKNAGSAAGYVNPVGSDAVHQGSGHTSVAPAAPAQPFKVHDPFLPAVQAGPKDVVVVAKDATLYAARDVPYAAWTFDGTVPGRGLRVVEGDTVNVTFRVDANASTSHSLDFHSAKTPPEVNYRTIPPGQELKYSFTAKHPGAYLYHCGTVPVLLHIGAGMYGAMIVDPKGGWPPAQELCFVQSELYLKDGGNGVKLSDMSKMMGNGAMDYVVFNGYANQYVDEPIAVKVGQPIRIFVVNAGPNIWSSFHVVGTIFDATYPNAHPSNKLVSQQSISIAPGDGACVEFVLEEPGVYPVVNHAFGHAAHGAMALLKAA